MNELTDIIGEEIEKMVGEYSRSDNKELFRVELERLVFLAQLEAIKDLVETVRGLRRKQK